MDRGPHLLLHSALLHNHNLVGVAHGGEAVRDDDGRAPARLEQVVQRRLHNALALVVQRGRGLVQQQDRRVLHHRARDGDPLLLPPGQLRPAAHVRLKPLRELHDEGVRVGHLRRRLALRARGAPLAVRDVLQDGAAEQHGLLPHQPDLRPQPLEVELAQVHAVQADRSLPRVVEALHQLHGGGLAAAA
eukprot:2649215-Pyramimonas_sp.AAC.2